MKTIKKAIKSGPVHWLVEYNEFAGSYHMHEVEYNLQKYTEKLLQERTILPEEIEELLDLHRSVVHYEKAMDECD